MRRAHAAPLIAAFVGLGAATFLDRSAHSQNATTPETLAPRLEDIERSIDKAKGERERIAGESAALQRDLAELRRQSIQIAAAIQAGEVQEAALVAGIEALSGAEAIQAAELERRRTELSALLMALQRVARRPPESLFLAPDPPIDAARRAKLLGHAVPEIETRAAALSRDLDRLAATRGRLAGERAALADSQAKLAAERHKLAAVIERKSRLHAETAAEARAVQRRVDRLARQSHDMRELIDRLNAERARREAEERRRREEQARLEADRREAERRAVAGAAGAEAGERSAARSPTASPRTTAQASGAPRRLDEPQGQMVPPVRGKLVSGYGQSAGGGQSQRGVTFETRPAAQVVAPFDGQVVFAGQFRAYGLILIIEHSEGYHTLLAGLGRIDIAAGERVAAGEPVGAAEDTGAGNPQFYVELRRNGQPIDPLPWLATPKEKVSG